MRGLWIGVLALWLAAGARGELYYYKDVLIGERASGLGGAFAALADDPSGLYHNPAGIATSPQDYLNLSANAFHLSRQTYENIYPGQDYIYRSRAFIPSFFGFTQKVGGGKFGFAVAVPNADDVDQDDWANRPASGGVEPRSFMRKVSRQDIVYLIGPGYARRVSESLSLGASVFAIARTYKLIDNTLVYFDPVGEGKYFLHNAHFNSQTFGALIRLGARWTPGPLWTVGLVVSKPYPVAGSGKSRILSTKTDAGGDPVTPDGSVPNDLDLTEMENVYFDLPSNHSFHLGVAYAAAPELVLVAQVDAHGPQGDNDEYPIRTVFNWSLGAEWHPSDWFALRGGLFSNNANTREVRDGGVNQAPQVDLVGATAAGTVYRSGTSVSLGLLYSYGVGRGQAFATSTEIQRVRHSVFGVYFAGSYQL